MWDRVVRWAAFCTALAAIAGVVVSAFVFMVWPLLRGIYLSFTRFNLLTPAKFNGLDNYVRLASDPNVLKSLLVTFRFAIIAIPLTMFASLGFALLLNSSKLVGRNIFRTLVYMPVQIPLERSSGSVRAPSMVSL